MANRPSFVLRIAVVACLLAAACASESDYEGSPHKVQVMLGMHANFYHSWRGDTNDEAGFGTDIRIVRAILEMLDEANGSGLDAKVYWELDNLFTLETILPEYAPDIIEDIRRRVEQGHDEVLLLSYSNTLLAGATENEMRAAVHWSISNPWGSGVRDLFGDFVPILRPQEYTTTTGMGRVLADEGIEGVILSYSGYPFNSLSTFLPRLSPEQRFGATWLRFEADGPRLVLLPAASIGDVLNQISIERWMLDLRKLQLEGVLDRDLLIHINFDADAESWIPQDLPIGLGWFPNSRGLVEYIEAVNKYEWAEFTTPRRYLKQHEPVGEVRVRRDLADGAFDGHYSWAEKFPSHEIWTELERARLSGRRAEALLADAAPEVRSAALRELYVGRDSSFFQRVRALSTTHFGMSTPMVNEERQAAAEAIVQSAREAAEAVERGAARRIRDQGTAGGALYAFHVRDLRAANSDAPSVPTLLRLPVLLSEPVPELAAVDADGTRLPASLVNLEVLGGGKVAAELWVPWAFAAGEVLELALLPGPASTDREPNLDDRLANAWIEVELDEETGIKSIRAGDWEFGGEDFLDPFVSYRTDRDPVTYSVSGFERIPLRAERLENLERVRMRGRIPFETPDGSVVALLDIDLTLPADAPWMIADVTVSYPYTTKRDVLNNIQQKLRRYLDLRWIEVAPFPLRPRLEATREQPIRIWKHNWLGVTSSFDLDYAAVNPKNAELDAFNHQVTAGWVAMSDRTHGLLVAQGAELRSVYAFTPMRLREHDGKQVLQVNPFGSYFGRQLDYTHMDGTGLGTDFTNLISASLRPNGPSYNGERERFSLMIAPYAGDAPPATLQAAADAFFHPPAVVVMEAPFDALLPVDIEREIDALRLARARRTTGPLPIPQAFLANPTHESVDLVWDVSRDPRIDGYDVEWRRDLDVDWQQARLGPVMRYRVGGLSDGERYAFRVRARSPGAVGVWTETSVVAVGPVEIVSAASAIEGAPILLLLRTFYYGLVHLFTTP